MIETILKQLGLSEKEIEVYLACLKTGPAPVRKIAQNSGINRGTAYDILKSLINLGLISYYHKDKHQYFIAEDPKKLSEFTRQKREQLVKMETEIEKIIPELESIYNNASQKPVVKYYEGPQAPKTILADVLISCQRNEEYYVYSSSTIKKYLYETYANFTRDRIKAGIKVKVISIGPGGEIQGLDERKWLTKKESAPTYTLIYAGKVAMISVGKDNAPIGIIIEDKNICQTQKIIFESLWKSLK